MQYAWHLLQCQILSLSLTKRLAVSCMMLDSGCYLLGWHCILETAKDPKPWADRVAALDRHEHIAEDMKDGRVLHGPIEQCLQPVSSLSMPWMLSSGCMPGHNGQHNVSVCSALTKQVPVGWSQQPTVCGQTQLPICNQAALQTRYTIEDFSVLRQAA